jgi:hypothetical protein
MPNGNKKVFISWSKQTSKRVAKVLKEYLPEILDGVDLFMSDKDIGPGERSMKVLESQLDGTTYGLLVVTAENQGESWLNFEAGALSKQVGKDEDDVPRVVPLLVDIDSPNLLTGPVSQFQAVKLDGEGMLRTIRSIAAFVGSDMAVIDKRFKRTWPDMSKALAAAKYSQVIPEKPQRSLESKIDEVLQILRTMQRRQDVDSDNQNALHQNALYLNALNTPTFEELPRNDVLTLKKLASGFNLKSISLLINIVTDSTVLLFRDSNGISPARLRDFEREVRNLTGPQTQIIYLDDADKVLRRVELETEEQ